MCTLVVLRRPDHPWPLILGANRDEMMARPWQKPARHWRDRPQVVAGLDELARGSWLGLNEHGVTAGILNRFGTLGPAPGQRSRGELVLEALDHADAGDAAAALGHIDPRAYRPFNMIVADNRDAFWIRHADAGGRMRPTATPLAAGLAMIAAGDLNDRETPRLRRYRPRFAAAAAPDPGRGDWTAWEELLADGETTSHDGPTGAMRFASERGFATVSSSLIALPAADAAGVKPVFRFRTWQPAPRAWEDVPI
jgi:uncharacterized protein with NRDE domain